MPEDAVQRRLTTLEVKFDNHEKKMDTVIDFMKSINQGQDEIKLTLAEQRGAGKMVKIMGGTAVALGGSLSGFLASFLHK